MEAMLPQIKIFRLLLLRSLLIKMQYGGETREDPVRALKVEFGWEGSPADLIKHIDRVVHLERSLKDSK
jgi:hypothetical protein